MFSPVTNWKENFQRKGYYYKNNLRQNYILCQMLHRTNRFGTGYSTSGQHYITLNGEMLGQRISQVMVEPRLKTKGKIILPASSISVPEIRMLEIADTNNLYELGLDTFQLPEGIIPLDVLHQMNHKTPHSLKIPILNTDNTKL